MTEDEFRRWPKCAVPACQLKCCLRLRSRFCWPHTPGDALEAQASLAAEMGENFPIPENEISPARG